MKLRNKTVMAIGMTWIVFLGLIFVEAKLLFFRSLVATGIVFFALVLLLVRSLFIKRLEKLDHDLSEICDRHELTRRIDIIGNDELTHVSQQINMMMDSIKRSHDQLEQRVDERTDELLESNLHLRQEINENKQDDFVPHKERANLAHYDSLTCLPNRIFFNEMLNKTIHQALRRKKMIAILFIDLDRFKKINDAFGHATGDLVLKEVAARFNTVLRSGDVMARLGGDEFIIMLNDIDHPKFASPVAKKLLQICSQHMRIEHHEFVVTTSIGICIFPDDGTSLEELQKNADMAMYKAKRAGGNVFEYFAREMNTTAHEHVKLETALRKAVINNEFVLYYQPTFNLQNGEITGVEALIRWDNPESGIISPAEFIPLAEETGMIMQIGEWAMREACRANKSWQASGFKPITVAVNLSSKQFTHPAFVTQVKTILSETGLDPQWLELEIRETALLTNIDQAIAKLQDLKNMGIHIAIDDFGTGYTSINHLKELPVDTLKIDQSLIKGITEHQNDLAITTAMIALAHSLGMYVVAEGVETANQLQCLADKECDRVQGYYMCSPLPEPKVILQFVKESSSQPL